ncbi:MAG: DUF1553 domain-containing protein, partial [Pirellulaceae bacterium]|nr:DUF1553 domain-containing protein [Pirellulaceae bacterium]
EGDRFLLTFGKPERLLACDCERSDETTLAQAFVLLGGDGIDQRLAASEGRLRRLADLPAPAADLVEELYWTALGRSPSDAEWRAGIELLEQSAARLEGLQDLAWGLLNSKEFIFRH